MNKPPLLKEVADYWNSKLNLGNKVFIPTAGIPEFNTAVKSPVFCEHWKAAIDKLDASFFATGRMASRSGSFWNVTFRFILNESNLCKVLSGEYDNSSSSTADRIGIDIA